MLYRDLYRGVVVWNRTKARRTTLIAEQQTLEAATRAQDTQQLQADLTGTLTEWRGLLSRQVPQARQILKKLLAKPIVFMPIIV